MEPTLLREIAQWLGAPADGPGDAVVQAVSTDTRAGCQGAVFFALRGEKADGHDYVVAAEKAGAVAAVVERRVPEATLPQLVVPDALQALGKLAKSYASRMGVSVVAVTGSVGKTTVRSMIAHILRAKYPVGETSGNFNTEIGLPLTLLSLDRTHRVAVVEMAMRGMGQIGYLARIAKPRLGAITGIGVSHIELLGSRHAIAEAKAELLAELPRDGAAVLPSEDDFAGYLRQRAAAAGVQKIVTFGQAEGADFRYADVQVTPDGRTEFTVNEERFVVGCPGEHLAANAAAACAAGLIMGVEIREAAERLRTWRSPDMRLTIRQGAHGVTVLDDSYNAAPDSMRAAIRTLAAMARASGRRAVAILGDMKELGPIAEEEHRRLGRLAEMGEVAALAVVGDLAALIAEESSAGVKHAFATSEDGARAIWDIVQPGDFVLVKGSRAMRMENITAALMGGEKV